MTRELGRGAAHRHEPVVYVDRINVVGVVLRCPSLDLSLVLVGDSSVVVDLNVEPPPRGPQVAGAWTRLDPPLNAASL